MCVLVHGAKDDAIVMLWYFPVKAESRMPTLVRIALPLSYSVGLENWGKKHKWVSIRLGY